MMSDSPSIILAFFAQTDIGLMRTGNEDNFLVLDLSTGKSWTALDEEPAEEWRAYEEGPYGTLLAVSDGMGGALAGEVASRLAVETVRDRMLQLQRHAVYSHLPFGERLRLAMEQANGLIHEEGLDNPLHKGLGATFTAVASCQGEAYFAQVGDSRGYLLRQGEIVRITKDQSLVQQLIDAGQITEQEAETHAYRNVILQALGAHPTVSVELNTVTLCQDDVLILCSDGLSGKLQDHEIAQIVLESSTYREACRVMIGLANHRGGEDNITVVIARFEGGGLPSPQGGRVYPRSLKRGEETPNEIDWSAGSGEDAGAPGMAPPPTQAIGFGPARPPAVKQPTAPRERTRRDDPITAVFSIESPSDEPTPGPKRQQGREKRPDQSHRSRASQIESTKGASKPRLRNVPILIGGGVILCVSIVLSVLWGAGSLFQSPSSRSSSQETGERLTLSEAENRREGQFQRLRNRIDQVEQRLNSQPSELSIARKPILEWQEKIKDLRRRLDLMRGLSPTEEELFSKSFEEIEQELSQIEGEFNRSQGPRTATHSDRDPIRI
ncbi:MAG: protein phosphatase 2C domain-containing protein [Blastocatellia bacterium]